MLREVNSWSRIIFIVINKLIVESTQGAESDESDDEKEGICLKGHFPDDYIEAFVWHCSPVIILTLILSLSYAKNDTC